MVVIMNCFRYLFTSGYRFSIREQLQNVIATAARPVHVVPTLNITQEFLADKRFHPTIIGAILLVFLFVVATFISFMESITYFDAFYACFITYSTIGFGDIDIYVRSRSRKIYLTEKTSSILCHSFHF